MRRIDEPGRNCHVTHKFLLEALDKLPYMLIVYANLMRELLIVYINWNLVRFIIVDRCGTER
jgi:hypothetical protein